MLAPLVIGVLYLGGWAFVALVVMASIGMQWEFYGIGDVNPPLPLAVLAALLTASILVIPMLSGAIYGTASLLLIAIAAVPFVHNTRVDYLYSRLLMGVIYPGSMLLGLVGIRMIDSAWMGGDGFWLALAVLVFVWATDIGAYYTGKSVGRRALYPRISPNKTWEGSVGGLVLTLLVAVVFAALNLTGVNALHLIVLAVITSVLGQIGDLVASTFKRAANTKDYGTLLPGHGGLTDRLDGVLLAAPAVYLYLVLVVPL